MLKKYRSNFITAIVIAAIFVSGSAISQSIKFDPIKPVAKQAILTDEQQGILAVRQAKAAVVNILGLKAPAAVSASSSPTISPGGDVQGVHGTGFIISADGLIVSNAHVIDNTSLNYTVQFSDGSEYPATVLGTDKYHDIGLLKIDAQNLPTETLGDSNSLETGQTVFAIGNSLGRYQYTVTRGVVSGLLRSVNVSDTSGSLPRLGQLIQTDAAINPGNSGGPLINLAGEVVGMNTLIDTEGASLNFAIPINTVKEAVSQLKAFGKASKSYLGVNFATITKTFLWSKPLPISQGAYLAFVTPEGPAGKAGIWPGDVITEINKEKLSEYNELDSVVGRYQPGSQLLITAVRGQQTLQFTVILGQF